MKEAIGSFCLFVAAVFTVMSMAGCTGKAPDPRLAPKIVSMPRQKMIVGEMKGDPAEKAKIVYTALYAIHGKLRGEGQEVGMFPIFRARYPLLLSTPPDERIGIYGLVVPEFVQEIPEVGGPAVDLRIEYWEYGDVAEILHIGPMQELKKSGDTLRAFISDKGYEITGPVEHEYIRYEGMVAPEKYETLLRLFIRKAG